MGFVQYSYAPRLMALMMVGVEQSAVRIVMSNPRPISRSSCRTTSRPDMSGRCMSSRMRSDLSDRANRIPSEPVAVVNKRRWGWRT